jgi:hypothetical protein
MDKAVKALAWSALGVSILFVILGLTAVFGWNALGPDTALMLGWWGAVPLVILALLLAVGVLVMAAFGSES